ncbi:hypothetical protein DFJ77DRAFT_337239 [Powellomyces hirtus]|nr:hypothetical protein DFJ77DRAFT_337239 [Powellomyces hirtus]
MAGYDDDEADDFCTVLGYQALISSFVAFVFIRHGLIPMLLNKLRGSTLNKTQRGLLANHLISYLHALYSTNVVLALFFNYPSLFVDLQGVRSGAAAVDAARKALAFSTGYFYADCFDMLVTGVYRNNLGIWGHHAAALVCYTASLHTCLLYPYLVFTLIVELNSIFLHHRKVLALYYPMDKIAMPETLSQTYDIATKLLLWTFPPTRLVANLYILYAVVMDRKTWEAPSWTWTLAFVGMLVVTYYNFGLWSQVKKSVERDRAKRANAAGAEKKSDDWVGQSGTELID